MANNNLTNIEIYRRKKHFNIGTVLFGVIFLYLIITILTYVSTKHVSVYEVREGSILKDTAYTGLILRNEEIVSSDTDGYVNYFVTEGSKVGKKTNIYSISQSKLDLDSIAEDEMADEQNNTLTTEEQLSIIQKSGLFVESYQSNAYSDIYNFKNSINDITQLNTSHSRQAKLDTLLQSGVEGLNVYPAVKDGIVIYSTDGYESLSLDDVTEDMIHKTDYKKTELSNNTRIHAGDPVYKLIQNDEWTVVIDIDDDMADQLIEKEYVKVRFSKDGETTWGAFKLLNKKNTNLGFFTFKKSMIRYATDRFIDIELILEDQSGLKIPKTSLVEKDFYLIPQDYMTKGGNSNQTGVLVQEEKDSVNFVAAEAFYHDKETDMCYVDTSLFEEGQSIIMPDSGNVYTIHDKGTLSGVYNVNKGFAAFKNVEISNENEEYYIVEEGSNYGLSNYDHIALDGKSVREKDLVF